MSNVKHIISISDYSICECTTFIWLKLGSQFIWSGFKSIKFDDSKKRQAGESVEDKDIIAYIEDVLVDVNNNCYLFRYNIDYI